MTRAVIRGQVGKEIVEGLKHVVVEPGVQGIAQLDDDTDWKARALAAEEEARAAKDFATSDAIRDALLTKGVEVMDGDPLGWDWKIDI